MKRRQTIILGCAAGLLAAGCVVVAACLTRPHPAPQAATPEQTAQYLASDAFAKMSPDNKRQYVREVQTPGSETPVLSLLFDPNLPEEQRRRMLENILPVVGPVIEQRLDEFDRLPLAEKTARLDALIDQLQDARRNNQGIMSSAERFGLVLQYVDPHTRARIRKYVPTVLARMQERGIQGGYPPL